MNARRFFTASGVVAVAGVAGAISYRHQEHLAATHGQGSLAIIWPVCIDGLVTVTALAISADRADGYRARAWALVGFWVGVVVSVTTNWMASSGGVINHGVSAFPALAFLLAVESLSSKPRTLKGVTDVPAAPAEPSLTRTPTLPAVPSTPLVSIANVGSGDAELVTSFDQPAPAKTNRQPRTTRSRKAPTVRPASKDLVAAARKRLPNGTSAEIAARAGVSESTARRHLPAIDALRMPAMDDVNTTDFDAVGRVPFDAFDDATEAASVNGHDVLAGAAA
jgi:Protein of unknown function (DUF2637)